MDTDRQNRKIQSLVPLFLSVVLSLLAFVVVQTPNAVAQETCEVYPGYTMTCPSGYFCGTVSGQKRCLPPSYITPTVVQSTPTPVPTTPTSGTTVQGSTWYSDGSTSKSGPSGTSVSAYATGAIPNTSYKLVTGTNGCKTDLIAVNNNIRYANSSGLISTTAGLVNRGVGTYDLCFADTSSATPATTTSVLSFAVTDTGTPPVTTITPTPPATQGPTVPSCNKSQGDANCDSAINLADFEQWRREFRRELTSTLADFNSDNKVDLIDFEIWRRGFFATGALAIAATATTTPAPVPSFDTSKCTFTTSGDGQITNGTEGADVICVSGTRMVVYGKGGNDTIYSTGQNVYIDAGAGDDSIIIGPGGVNSAIYGMDGNDSIDTKSSSGNNAVDAGAGTDTCYTKAGDSVVNCEQ